MAAGLPVAASRVASIPEICGDAVAYFDARDAEDMASVILKVLESSELRESLIARGRRHVSQYSWATATSRVAEVFREVTRG